MILGKINFLGILKKKGENNMKKILLSKKEKLYISAKNIKNSILPPDERKKQQKNTKTSDYHFKGRLISSFFLYDLKFIFKKL